MSSWRWDPRVISGWYDQVIVVRSLSKIEDSWDPTLRQGRSRVLRVGALRGTGKCSRWSCLVTVTVNLAWLCSGMGGILYSLSSLFSYTVQSQALNLSYIGDVSLRQKWMYETGWGFLINIHPAPLTVTVFVRFSKELFMLSNWQLSSWKILISWKPNFCCWFLCNTIVLSWTD